jgi:hypothetical protein
MAKFEFTLKELGLSVNDLSAKIKKDIIEYNSSAKDVNQLENSIEDNDNEDQKIEMLDALNEAKTHLIEADNEIIKNIIRYNKNKDGYAERITKMHEKRGYSKPPANDNVEKPNVNNYRPNVNEQTYKPNIVEEKKSDWGFWAFAGLIGIVTLGSVMLNKK